MQIEHPLTPVEVLKKKISDDGTTVLYKIKWNNQSITYEPMADLRKECCQAVNRYELGLMRGSVAPPSSKSEKQTDKN